MVTDRSADESATLPSLFGIEVDGGHRCAGAGAP